MLNFCPKVGKTSYVQVFYRSPYLLIHLAVATATAVALTVQIDV